MPRSVRTVWDIRFDGTFFEGGIAKLEFDADVLFGGAYERHARWAMLAGAGVGMEVGEHRRDRARASRMDSIAMARVVDVLIEPTMFFGSARLRTSLELAADFAGVTPIVVPQLADDLPTVTEREGYYYAIGATVAPAAELRTRRADIGGMLRTDGFLGIPGWDCFPSPTRGTAALSDVWLRTSAWVTVRPLAWLGVTARIAHGLRGGAIDMATAHADETRVGIDVTLVDR